MRTLPDPRGRELTGWISRPPPAVGPLPAGGIAARHPRLVGVEAPLSEEIDSEKQNRELQHAVFIL